MSEHTSFLEIFPGAASHISNCGGLEKAYVTDVEISLEAGTMSIRAHFARTPAPAELDSICTALRADYGLRVSIIADSPEKSLPAHRPRQRSRQLPPVETARCSWDTA